MNYLFIQLNNIDIPEERFDILSIGEGIDVEMYLESPAHLLTYKGEEMTDVVEQSSIREDLGKYDFMALIRKPFGWIQNNENGNSKIKKKQTVIMQ